MSIVTHTHMDITHTQSFIYSQIHLLHIYFDIRAQYLHTHILIKQTHIHTLMFTHIYTHTYVQIFTLTYSDMNIITHIHTHLHTH